MEIYLTSLNERQFPFTFLADKNIIEQGGHPKLGFENHYETHMVDDCYNAIKKGRARRLKRINNGR